VADDTGTVVLRPLKTSPKHDGAVPRNLLAHVTKKARLNPTLPFVTVKEKIAELISGLAAALPPDVRLQLSLEPPVLETPDVGADAVTFWGSTKVEARVSVQ
jgi:hypothetical protein